MATARATPRSTKVNTKHFTNRFHKNKVIQTQTQILIKDNSGLFKGRCINKRTKSYQKIAGHITVAVTKVKALSKRKGSGSRPGHKQDLIIIQTKKPLIRYDGSTIRFHTNCGVCINATHSGSKPKRSGSAQLGFKRIQTTVPFELKTGFQGAKNGHHLIKLAKTLV